MTKQNACKAKVSFRAADAVRFFSVLFFYRGYYFYRARNARLKRSA